MKRKVLLSLGIFVLIVLACGAVHAGWSCDFDGNKKGTVGKPNSLTIDMGTILWADIDNGATTKVLWPTSFDHYNNTTLAGTWTRQQIVTPSGNFVLRLTLRLAGRKSWGIWTSKRNVVTVEVHKGDASGDILQQKTLDKSVGSPSNSTIELPQVTADLSSNSGQAYTVVLRYDKYDGNASNDSWCGCSLTVTAD
jgi:hypothetical protein